MNLMPLCTGIAVIVLAGCSASASSSSSSSSSAAPAAAVTTHKAKPKAAKAEASCNARKGGYGDLLIRVTAPGIETLTTPTAGGWLWDGTSRKCLDAVAWNIATAGTLDGECTTIALASDNPGYDPDAAPPLKHVIESAGPGC